ncbi:acyltransferase family protein [Nocardioides pacificus]
MSGRIAGLDLLRGIAIALVMLRHALPAQLPGAGVVGVVMFFTLSGYLITGVLLGELERTGRVDLRRFYARRALRLVPAMLLLVAGVVGVTLLLDPLGDRDELPRTVLVALTWTANLPFDQGSDATFHLWTLATEEQFYLLWPAVLALAVPRGRVRTALVVVAALCLTGCVATLVWLSSDADLAYALPTSWAVCFVIGAATRVATGSPYDASYGPRAGSLPALAAVGAGRAATLALTGLLVLSVVPLRGHALTYLAGGPAIAGLTAVLVVVWRRWSMADTPQAWAPLTRGLIALGTVSYGAYLWNYPITLWLRAGLGQEPVAGALGVVLTLLAAALSWRLVEEPAMRRWRSRTLPRVPAPVGSGT